MILCSRLVMPLTGPVTFRLDVNDTDSRDRRQVGLTADMEPTGGMDALRSGNLVTWGGAATVALVTVWAGTGGVMPT